MKQKKKRIIETFNNTTLSIIKNYGDNSTHATDMTGWNKRPSKSIEISDTPDNFLPTHFDNFELQLGIDIEAKRHPELKNSPREIATIALNNIEKNKRFYSNFILQGRETNPDTLALYTKLFNSNAIFMVPRSNVKEKLNSVIKSTTKNKINHKLESKMKLKDIKRIIREEVKKYLTEEHTSLSNQLSLVASGKTNLVDGEEIKPDEAKKMLMIYKLLSPAQQQQFDDGDIQKAREFLKNVEDAVKAIK